MAGSHHYLFDCSIHIVVTLVLFLGTVHGQDPSAVTVATTGWSSSQKESRSYFVCPSNQVMTGRRHSGDENGQTWYQCGVVKNDGHAFEVPGSTAQWSGWCKESSCTYICPYGKVMIGRQHSGDENGNTRYQCAEVYHNGLKISYRSNHWSGEIKESNSWFDCPSNAVMVGRYHRGDENGKTSYRCATFLTHYSTTPLLPQYKGENTGCGWQGKIECPPFVFYLNQASRSPLALRVNKAGKYVENSFNGGRFTTSGSYAIFTMGVFGDIYASNNFHLFMFHHSSFFGGRPVAAAGQIYVNQGRITKIDSCSGHYRPSDDITRQAIDALTKQGYPTKDIIFSSCHRIGDVLFDYMRAHKIEPVELAFSKLHAEYLGPGNTTLCHNTTDQESCRRPVSVKVPRFTTVELCFEGDKCRFFREGVHQVRGGIVKQALVKTNRKQPEWIENSSRFK